MLKELEGGVCIRLLKKDDHNRIVELAEQFPRDIVKPGELKQRIEKIVLDPDSIYIVAVKGGYVVGCVGIFLNGILFQAKTGSVVNFIVDQSYRSQGIGTGLATEICRIAKKEGVHSLKLVTEDPVTQHIFEKLGLVVQDIKVMATTFT